MGMTATPPMNPPAEVRTIDNYKIYSAHPEEFGIKFEDGTYTKWTHYNLILKPDSNIRLEEIVPDSTINGVFSLNVNDGRLSLENLSKQKGNCKYQTNTREVSRGLSEDAKGNDSISLDLFNRAVKDGVINPKKDSLYVDREWKIKEGRYVIYSINRNSKNGIEKSIPSVIDLYLFPEEKKQVHLKDAPKECPPLELIFGGGIGENGKKIITAGVKKGSFAIGADYSTMTNQVVLTTPVGQDIEKDIISTAINFEFYPHPNFGIGVGHQRESSTLQVEENIFDSDSKVIGTNSDSYSRKKGSTNFQGTLRVPGKKSNFNLEGVMGYNDRDGFYGKTRFTIPIKNPNPRDYEGKRK